MHLRVRRFAALGLLLLTLLVPLDRAAAMTVRPVVIDLTSTGRTAAAAINVVNTHDRPLPVEITIRHAGAPETDDPQRLEEPDESFLIFPPQALIPPRATQVFRIQWVGEPELAVGRGYVFSVNQLPVELPEGQSAIQIVFNFLVLVNVDPPNGEPALTITGGTVVTQPDGRPAIEVVVENVSPVHGYLSRSRLDLDVVDDSGAQIWSRRYQPEELRQLVGLGLIRPNRERRFTLPLDVDIARGQVSGRIDRAGRR